MEKCYNSRAKSKINYMYTLWLHIKCEFKDWGNLNAIKPFYSFVHSQIYIRYFLCTGSYAFCYLGFFFNSFLLLIEVWNLGKYVCNTWFNCQMKVIFHIPLFLPFVYYDHLKDTEIFESLNLWILKIWRMGKENEQVAFHS